MNSNQQDNADRPEIIDLEPDAVTDHDKPANSAPKANTGRKNWTRPSLWAAALLAAAIAGGWVYKDYLWRYLPSEEVSTLLARTKTLEDGSAALRDQVAALERLSTQLKSDVDASESTMAAAAAGAKSASESVAVLSGRVDGIATSLEDTASRIAALTTQIENLPVSGSQPAGTAAIPADILKRLEALEKDVASLKGEQGNAAADTALLSQSLSDLKAKLASGAPFADELGRIQRLVPAAPGLDVLSRHAATGLPDAKALGQELSALAVTLPAEGELAPATPDDSWTGWALDKLSDLVTIRTAGNSDWKRASEAAAALAESGDLPQAIEHLNAVEGAKPAGVQQWLDRAAARIEIESQLKAIEEAVLRVIAAKG